MLLKSITLQNFRSYSKSEFSFNEGMTLIVGPNTSGKTNIIEAIWFLATGGSFRAEKDTEVIAFGKDIARIAAEVENNNGDARLEVVLTSDKLKRYTVNGVARRRLDFVGNIVCVLFSPLDLDIITGSPSLRRRFLDEVLIQVDKRYWLARTSYDKALRQRNALLERARDTGKRDEKNFLYWDDLLIEHGQTITKKREELIFFLNEQKKEVFPFQIVYDKNIISKDRLAQYYQAEMGAGVTLVGPHRDDFSLYMFDPPAGGQVAMHNMKLFGSRGQQRLAVLQLLLLELSFIEQTIGERPLLLLDDIFSELDEEHIHHVLEVISKQQTILTTTHKEFIDKHLLKSMDVIELQ